MKLRDSNSIDISSDCCPGIKLKETESFWPPLYKDEKTKEPICDLILKFAEEKIKMSSIHYKLCPKTKKLSAFKIQYTHGVETPLLIAKHETEDDMQIFTLKKKQLIAKMYWKRIDKTTKEAQFIDQNDDLILSLRCYSFKQYIGRYADDSFKLAILEGNTFLY